MRLYLLHQMVLNNQQNLYRKLWLDVSELVNALNSTSSVAGTAAFGGVFPSGSPFSNVANEAFSGSIRIWNPHTSFYTTVSSIGGSYTLPNSDVYGAQFYTFGFKRKEAAQVNAIRFYFESGNIASGEIVMYGIANGS